MNVIITYDIVGNRRRTRFHKFLKELGLHSQLSVFECRLDPREVELVRGFCNQHLDPDEDSVRIYHVCASCLAKAMVLGQGVSLPQLDWVVV